MTRLAPRGKAFSDVLVEIFCIKTLTLHAAEALAAEVGLTSTHWQILGFLEREPVPVAHVARAIGLTRQSVQQAADAMEGEGLIAYEENPYHKRARLMTLTPKAHKALDYLRPHQIEWANQMGSGHTLEALRTTLDVLHDSRTRLERALRKDAQ